jgi:hypothetical protein
VRVCDAQTQPYVSSEELQDILDECAVARVREPAIAYAVGERIVLSPSNGRMYKAMEAGTSAATAPSFTNRKQLRDGTVLWEDDGPAHSDLWDMGAAKRKALLAKAEKCAAFFDAREAGVDHKLSQRVSHYWALASNYDSEFAP